MHLSGCNVISFPNFNKVNPLFGEAYPNIFKLPGSILEDLNSANFSVDHCDE